MSEFLSRSDTESGISQKNAKISSTDHNLSVGMEKIRSKMLLGFEILQSIRQADNIDEIFKKVTTRLLDLADVVQVSIYKIDKLAHHHRIRNRTKITGKIIAEAVTPYCEPYSQIDIENILRGEYQWGQNATKQIIDLYTAERPRYEINLAAVFADKAYLLVPIVLLAREQESPLWGFLIVHQCTDLGGESLQSSWDQDDVMMLQQIAVQIEIALQKESRNTSLLEKAKDAEQAYTTLYRWMEQYRYLVEQIPNVSYISPITNTTGFAYISPQIQTLLEIHPSRWDAGFFNIWVDYVHPDDLDRVQQEVLHTINTGEPFCCEYRMIASTGKIIWVRDTAHLGLATDGKTQVLRGSAFDISDRKLTETKLLQNEALLKLTLANAPVGIATFDLEGKFLMVNQGFCKTFGYAESELLNMTVLMLTHPNSGEKTLAALNRLLNDEADRVKVEKQYIHKHGHKIDVISRFGLVRDENGKPIQFVTGVEDVTERKHTEERLAAAQIAESANKAKSEFLAVMSHELRTPMNAVIGMTDILQNTPLSNQQQQYVTTIRQGGNVLLSVINNILDFSRIESGRFELEEQPFKLQQCIEEVLELMASRTAEKSLELTALVGLDVPRQLIGDYARLRQILVNLVSNAIKFTESGEIVVTVNSQLSDRQTNTYDLRFEVRDTGIGIDPNAISRLFKAFSQADNSIARQYGGTGLGLAICKELCELMGGKIGVSSTVGGGSTFSFSIVAQAVIEHEAPQAIAPELHNKIILSVSTNSTIQQAIALYTQPWGIKIQIAYSATDALKFLTTSNFDAVIIDRQLIETDGSQIDGLQLAKNIQEIFPTLKLVILNPINIILKESGNINSAYLGDWITKPISESKLYQSFCRIFTGNQVIAIPHSISSIALDESTQFLGNDNFAKCCPLKILVVEDNPVNQKILLLMLENLGYKAEAVENGQRAIDALLNQTYDLIFMDIQMSIMDGLTATASIRQLPIRQPWIIGLSANAFSESREAALSAGMNDYLTKPLKTTSLITSLQRISQRPPVAIVHEQSPIDLSTLASLEDSVGTDNLEELIIVYLEHSAQAIITMKEAFKNNNFVTIEAENHALKGGSATFGATHLFSSCQALQALCKLIIKINKYTEDDLTKIGNLLDDIEEQYSYVYQTFQSRRVN